MMGAVDHGVPSVTSIAEGYLSGNVCKVNNNYFKIPKRVGLKCLSTGNNKEGDMAIRYI